MAQGDKRVSNVPYIIDMLPPFIPIGGGFVMVNAVHASPADPAVTSADMWLAEPDSTTYKALEPA